MQINHNLNTALMLLEMVLVKVPGEPSLASDEDMLWAAHSYAQASGGKAPVSEEALALYAHIRASIAIEDAARE